jgi:hypothetical protein
MAELRPQSKRPPSPPANQGRVESKTLLSRAVRTDVSFAGGPRQDDEEPPLLVESDLSGEMAVRDQELDAIIPSRRPNAIINKRSPSTHIAPISLRSTER